MNKREQILDFLFKNKSKFEKEFNVTKIGLFGSFVSEKNNEKSDIDLIVEFKPNTEMLFEKKNNSKGFAQKTIFCRSWYMPRKIHKKLL